jgi:hypothetical protein
MASCSFNSTQLDASPQVTEVKESIDSFFSSIKVGNLSDAASYLYKNDKWYNNNLKFKSQTQQKIVKEEFAKINYKIISSSYGSENVEVLLQINSADLLDIYGQMMKKFLGPIIDKYIKSSGKDKELAKNQAKELGVKYLNEELSNKNYPKTTNKVKLKLVKENGKWVIKMNEDFVYALTGRMPGLLGK